ncbi:LexA family protein [Devosia sp. Naph2]|uniref:LexA family protein n=1 Tax=Devosia polycyclovorans TaxID=3345148 RepID=UPI0035D0DD71
MNKPDHISDEAYEWAEIFMDAHRGVEDDRELLALAFMELQQKTQPTAVGLTKKQTETLRFIKQYRSIHGLSPTYREIAARFDIHVSGVHDLVKDLQERGYITMMPHRARSIALVVGA